MNFDYDASLDSGAKIKVIGVGGAGNNAVNRMVSEDVKGVDFVAVNTDKQALHRCAAPGKVLIGEKLTKGRGAGANPDVGKNAAEENLDDIKKILDGTDMVFITAGMGGGTGTGAAPIVAQIAKEMGILTVGIVTKPFAFEGRRRMEQAEMGILALREHVDALVVVPNEKLKYLSDTKITLVNAFEVADDVLRHGVQSISDLINIPGLINLDFADVTAVMKDAGQAHMGVGRASGKDKAADAAAAAISSPLLETSINGAKGVIINIIASPDISLEDVDLASSMVRDVAHPDANIIWGAALDPSFNDEMQVTVIATNFESEESFPQQEKAQEEKPAEKDPASAILESLGISDEEEKQEIDEFEVIRKIFDR